MYFARIEFTEIEKAIFFLQKEMNQAGYALAIVKDMALLPLAGYLLCKPLSWKEETNESVPILLIHGSGFNQSEWLVGRQYLTNKNVYSFNWDTSKGDDIEHYTSLLEEKINEIVEPRPNRDIILIGYSMGGLMAGYYTEYLAKSKGVNVLQVITISTPWQGTSALKPFVNIRNFFGMKPMAKRYQQMLPQDVSATTFLRELNNRINNSSTKYITIGSHHDLMVPYPSCHLESATSQTTLWGFGHYSIIISPTLWRNICEIINTK